MRFYSRKTAATDRQTPDLFPNQRSDNLCVRDRFWVKGLEDVELCSCRRVGQACGITKSEYTQFIASLYEDVAGQNSHDFAVGARRQRL